MKSILVFLLLIVLSSCAYFENEVFENSNQNIILEPGEEADDKSFFGPGYGFWKELRSVERGKIELSREYKDLEKKPNGYTSWIGHSSFIINNFDLNIITDPIFSERASPFSFFGPKRLIPPAIDYEDLPNIDVIVISHNHYDHLDKKTIRNLNRINPDIIYLVPHEAKKVVCRAWAQKMFMSLIGGKKRKLKIRHLHLFQSSIGREEAFLIKIKLSGAVGGLKMIISS